MPEQTHQEEQQERDRPILDLSEFIWTDPALIMRGPRPQQFRGRNRLPM